MRPPWNCNQDRNVEAENDRLRRRYEDRRENIQTDPVGIPHKLTRAICGPRWSGEPVLVTASGRDVAVVLGTESTDAQAIWRDIAAAVQADEDTGTGVRLIPAAPFAEGLRAIAVPSEQQVVVWRSSAESVTNRQRRIAARRALRALRGHKIPPAVRLSLLVPGWRKAIPIAAAATAAVVVAVLISAGPVRHPNRSRPSPAVATPQVTAGTSHDHAPTPSSGPVDSRRSNRSSRSGRSGSLAAGGAAPSQHGRTATLPPGSAPSAGRTSASPTSSSLPPSPHPTVRKKVCALSVLGMCVRWK
jgi:hypothetical protein